MRHRLHSALAAAAVICLAAAGARAQSAAVFLQRGEEWKVFIPATSLGDGLHSVLESLRSARSPEQVDLAGKRLDRWESDFVADLYRARYNVSFYSDTVTPADRLRFWELVLLEKRALLALKLERSRLKASGQGARFQAKLEERKSEIALAGQNGDAASLERYLSEFYDGSWKAPPGSATSGQEYSRNGGGADTRPAQLAVYNTVSTWPPPSPSQSSPRPSAPDRSLGGRMVEKAREVIRSGARYVWGGAGPTRFDCSGLILYLYRSLFHVNLPHSATAQARLAGRGQGGLFLYAGKMPSGWVRRDSIQDKWRRTSPQELTNEMRPGDLIFLSHTGDFFNKGDPRTIYHVKIAGAVQSDGQTPTSIHASGRRRGIGEWRFNWSDVVGLAHAAQS